MKTLFQMGFRPAEIGQFMPVPNVLMAEKLCHQAVTAQMDIQNPNYVGNKAARFEDRERAIDELVTEMRRIKKEATAIGLRPEIDFEACRITFRPLSAVTRTISGPHLGQANIWTAAGALISAAGSVAASYMQKEAQEEIQESRERIATAQLRAEEQRREEERKRAEAEAMARPDEMIRQEPKVLGIPLTYVMIGGGVIFLGTILLLTRK